MKKIFVILTIVATLLMAAPVAAGREAPMGEQINVYVGPEHVNYSENTPFYIMHGWMSTVTPGVPPDVAKFSTSGFALEIDGEYVEEDYMVLVRVPGEDPGTSVLYQRFYFLFPDGMTGEHTFTGHWTIACKYWQETCENPNEILEVLTRAVTATFDTQ